MLTEKQAEMIGNAIALIGMLVILVWLGLKLAEEVSK